MSDTGSYSPWAREVGWPDLVIDDKLSQQVEITFLTLIANAAGLNKTPTEHNEQMNFQTAHTVKMWAQNIKLSRAQTFPFPQVLADIRHKGSRF